MKEIWKDVPWYEGMYQVSTLWRVKSLWRKVLSGNRWWQWKPEKILKQFVGQWHCRVVLMKEGVRNDVFVHRLVASAFLWVDVEFNWKNLICHKNDVGTDNRVENLYIGTYSDNNKDTVRNWHWVDNSNENHWMCKLTNKQIKEIRRLLDEKVNQYKIAKMYWITQWYVSNLKNNLYRRKLVNEL